MLFALTRHWYDKPVPAFAVKLTRSPAQMLVVPLAVIVAVGKALTVTDLDALATQPLASVTVTMYGPAPFAQIAIPVLLSDHT
jgi:hypothetical protein